MLHVIASAQKNGGLAAFIDAEHALDPAYAKKLGVNLDDLLVSQPDSGEEALTICETLARSNALDVIVIDSVAALVPKSELEGEMGMATMGMQARLMSQALRKLTAILNKSKTTCVFTNQLREKVGVMFGNPETTPGGKALKFYASVRIDIRRKDTLKDAAGNAVGNHVKVKIVKNKVAPPFAEAEFDIIYNHGINKEGSILDVGIECGAVDKKGAWLQFDGELIGQGKDAAKKALAEKFGAFTEHWRPKIVAELNGQEVKLVKFQGSFPWHAHENEDEMFLVWRGQMTIEFRDGRVVLEPGEFCVVPRGVEHRTMSETEAEVLIFEPAATRNTGNFVDDKFTAPNDVVI
jgi:protein RecA